MKKRVTFQNLVLLFLIIQPIFELVPFYNSYTTLFRIIVIFLFFLYALIKNKDKKVIIGFLIYFVTVFLYFIIHNMHALNIKIFEYNTFDEMLYFIKMVTPFMLIYVVSTLKIKEKEIKRYLVLTLFFAAGSIIVANIFKIGYSSYSFEIIKGNIFDWFSNTYDFDELASKGFFYFTNHIVAIFLMFLPIVYYYFIKDKKMNFVILIVVLMLALLMLGNKSSVFGSYLLFVILTIISKFLLNIKFNKKVLIVTLSIILVFPILMYYSPAYDRVVTKEGTKLEYKSSKETKEDKINYIENNYKKKHISKRFLTIYYPYKEDTDFWINIMKQKEEKRIDYRYLETEIMKRVEEKNNNKLDLLLGIGYDREMNIVNIERDYVNQFYAVGIIGLILFIAPYLVLFIYLLFKLYKKKEEKDLYYLLSIFIILALAYLTGNLFNSLSIMIPFSFILGYLLILHNDKKMVEL